MKNQFGVVDIFAGPGGLAEGFSRVEVDGNSPFKVELSIEHEASAHRTLRLRSFIHQFGPSRPSFYIDMLNAGLIPDEEQLAREHPKKWAKAEHTAKRLTLAPENRGEVESLLHPIINKYKNKTILIGGPPCQVYSLAGRSRNLSNPHYKGDDDHRHQLYREYIHILDYLRPAVFIMENVKGMLSSQWNQQSIFSIVRDDLESIGDHEGYGYSLMTVSGLQQRSQQSFLVEPDHRDFIVKSEQYGVPQRRHRIIIIGIRKDFAKNITDEQFAQGLLPDKSSEVHIESVLDDMPLLRSGLSKGEDTLENWQQAIRESFRVLKNLSISPVFTEKLNRARSRFESDSSTLVRSSAMPNNTKESCTTELLQWLIPVGLKSLPNNETRSHIREDLTRYLFAAISASATGESPKAHEFPDELTPAHRNWKSGKFADRFRVQAEGRPSTTITSHISKDGHYYIHPDPVQCRSLTVREAARLQTFPDDYVFMGNRTQQYVQVGNAVPPYLAMQIAKALCEYVLKN